MYVTYESEQIRFLVTEDRFISVLEEMPSPFMTAIVILGVPGELLSHDGRYAVFAAFKEQVNVIGHEDPCIHLALVLSDVFREPFEKTGFILIVVEYRGFVYPPNDDVV